MFRVPELSLRRLDGAIDLSVFVSRFLSHCVDIVVVTSESNLEPSLYKRQKKKKAALGQLKLSIEM